MRFLQKLLVPFQTALKSSLETFIRLETADDEITLAAADGSLITYVRVHGSRQIIGEEEYNSGEVQIHDRAKIGYLTQHDPFEPSEKVITF